MHSHPEMTSIDPVRDYYKITFATPEVATSAGSALLDLVERSPSAAASALIGTNRAVMWAGTHSAELYLSTGALQLMRRAVDHLPEATPVSGTQLPAWRMLMLGHPRDWETTGPTNP